MRYLVAAVLVVLASAAPSAAADQVPRCFGAPSMDPATTCRNPQLARMVSPSPTAARQVPPWPCTPIVHDPSVQACAFGTPPGQASATVAVLGDSHAMHWRAALDGVARAKGWYAYSVALGGCGYSTATRSDLPGVLIDDCQVRNAAVPRFFQQHPEVHTVFLAQISGAHWLFPTYENQFRGEVRHYLEAWSRLPPTITHLVVIRDTPKADRGTRSCIRRAMGLRLDAGQVCKVPRSIALQRDAAVEAARRLHTPRVRVLNLTDDFCDKRWCYPVIGGALVQKDINHVTPIFMQTMTPFLLRDLNRLITATPGWAGN